MRDQNNKELSPCIVSWAKFALEIKPNKPTNSKKCVLKYWKKVIDIILSTEKYESYQKNKNKAMHKFDLVEKL